jgi:hypothetical protein
MEGKTPGDTARRIQVRYTERETETERAAVHTFSGWRILTYRDKKQSRTNYLLFLKHKGGKGNFSQKVKRQNLCYFAET